MNYHKDMTVQEALYSDDMVLDVFLKHKLPCSTCGGAASETLEVAARVHNCDLNELLKDLNKAVKKED